MKLSTDDHIRRWIWQSSGSTSPLNLHEPKPPLARLHLRQHPEVWQQRTCFGNRLVKGHALTLVQRLAVLPKARCVQSSAPEHLDRYYPKPLEGLPHLGRLRTAATTLQHAVYSLADLRAGPERLAARRLLEDADDLSVVFGAWQLLKQVAQPPHGNIMGVCDPLRFGG